MGTPTLYTNVLTMLEALRQLPGIDEADISQDSVLTRLVNRASASIENALGRKLRRSTYTERVRRTGSQYLLVKNHPTVAVEKIKQVGEIVDPGLYDATVRGNVGTIYKDNGWTCYDFPHRLTGDIMTGSQNITTRYTAGYVLPWEAIDEAPTNLPADLEGLTQEMVQYILEKPESGGSGDLKTLSISDVRREWSNRTPSS